MKLIYRGASYELIPSRVAMVNAGITARYRGVSYSVRCPCFLPKRNTSSLELKYRGVSYYQCHDNIGGYQEN